jgi:peptidyl-prolyl cis-trans isomerase SurA
MNKFAICFTRQRGFSPLCTALLSLSLLCGGLDGAQAQNATAKPVVSRSADYIVALVNSEPITHNDVQQQRARMVSQWPAGAPLPPAQELTSQALEQLILEKVQLQQARESGLRIEEDAVDQAEANVARQNQMDKDQLRAKLSQEGLSLAAFRTQIRNQLTLSRLREREVEARVRISESEVNQFLRDQRGAPSPVGVDLNLAMLLVNVPEDSSAAQISALQVRAESAARRARAGEDFAGLVNEFMNDKVPNGGAMGLRPSDRYPSLFVENTLNLKVGEIAGPLRSGAGFHVLKVLEKRQGEAATVMVTQTRARHILLRTSAQLTPLQAQTQLQTFKQSITSGQSTFAALAREHSQDGSASSGGDLGWTSPGQFVPEFEQVMNRLRPNQISDPLVSRFGVHLIEVTERREVPVSASEQREMARNLLREKKLDEALTSWQEDLRARAYVEMRDPPQ